MELQEERQGPQLVPSLPGFIEPEQLEQLTPVLQSRTMSCFLLDPDLSPGRGQHTCQLCLCGKQSKKALLVSEGI